MNNFLLRNCMFAGCAAAVAACSGQPGEVELAPPLAGQGWQWQTERVAVASGTETQVCYVFAVPGNASDEVWVDHVTVAQNTGSHHMNIFRVKTIIDLGGRGAGEVVRDGACWVSSNWADWPLVINSQDDQTVDWKLPSGVGMKFRGGELLMLQSHYVNARTQRTPTTAHALANFYLATPPPPQELGTIFATNQNIRICPGDTNKMFEARCTFPSAGITIVGANGHFHSRGVEFDIYPVDTLGIVGARFYQSRTWSEPPMARGLNVQVAPGGGIDYSCSFSARSDQCGTPSDECCFTFGGRVETQEHCNAFVYYYPKVQDVNCF